MTAADTLIAEIDAILAAGGTDAQARCRAALEKALKRPDLLDGFAEQMTLGHEFHMHRRDGCAIKVFPFKETDGPSFAHDHAGFWAVYGVYRGLMNSDLCAEENPGAEPWPGIAWGERLAVRPGETFTLPPDQLHGVWSPTAGTFAIAIYNGDLNSAPRRIYDWENKVYIHDRSQWEKRRQLGQFFGGNLRPLAEHEITEEV